MTMQTCYLEGVHVQELMWHAYLRGQASEVGVLHEASRFRSIVILGEVWQRTLVKSKGDTLALHVLLPHTPHHLQHQWDEST